MPRTVEAVLRYGEAMRKIAMAQDAELRACEERRQALVDAILDAIKRMGATLTKP